MKYIDKPESKQDKLFALAKKEKPLFDAESINLSAAASSSAGAGILTGILTREPFRSVLISVASAAAAFTGAYFLFNSGDMHSRITPQTSRQEHVISRDTCDYGKEICLTPDTVIVKERIFVDAPEQTEPATNEDKAKHKAVPSPDLLGPNTAQMGMSRITESSSPEFSSRVDIPDFDPYKPQINNNLGLSFRFSGFKYFHDPAPNVNPEEFNVFNSLGIGVFHEIGQHLIIGAELRQETFFCIYTGSEQYGSEYRYYRQPNLTSATFIAGYSKELPYGLRLSGEFGLGGNQVGYVVRPALTLDYDTGFGFAFTMGADYGLFLYRYQNEWFNSSKFGLNYGIKYSL